MNPWNDTENQHRRREYAKTTHTGNQQMLCAGGNLAVPFYTPTSLEEIPNECVATMNL